MKRKAWISIVIFTLLFWGSIAYSCAQSPSAWNTVTKTSNQTSVTTSLADVTDLNFPVVSGTYMVMGLLYYTTDASTTGIFVSVNCSVAASLVSFSINTATTSTSVSIRNFDVLNGGSTNTTGGGAQKYPVILNGIITVGSSGTFTLRFANELGAANSATILANSSMWYQKIN